MFGEVLRVNNPFTYWSPVHQGSCCSLWHQDANSFPVVVVICSRIYGFSLTSCTLPCSLFKCVLLIPMMSIPLLVVSLLVRAMFPLLYSVLMSQFPIIAVFLGYTNQWPIWLKELLSCVIIPPLRSVIDTLLSRIELALFLVSVIMYCFTGESYQPSAQPQPNLEGQGFSVKVSFPYYTTVVSALMSSICPGLKSEFPSRMWFIVSTTGWKGLLRRLWFVYRWLCLGTRGTFGGKCRRDQTPLSSLVWPPRFGAQLFIWHVIYSQLASISGLHSRILYTPPGDAPDGEWCPIHQFTCNLKQTQKGTRKFSKFVSLKKKWCSWI